MSNPNPTKTDLQASPWFGEPGRQCPIFRSPPASRMAIGPKAAQKTPAINTGAKCRDLNMGGPSKPGLASLANVSKQGLFARPFASHQTTIVVNVWLPNGILGGGNAGRPTASTPGGSRFWGLKSKPPACLQQDGRFESQGPGELRPELGFSLSFEGGHRTEASGGCGAAP